jgi:hypothetical protein
MTDVDTSVESPAPRRPLVVPEDDDVFRLAQLLLLLNSLNRNGLVGGTLERLSYYDFLVANPLLVLTNDDDPDRISLLMAGFDDRALMYASPSQRFTTRRERLQYDLARLVAYGLVEPTVNRGVVYVITSEGEDLADKFTAIYSRSYSASADILVRRLARLSDKRLRENARDWITISPEFREGEMIDILYRIDLLDSAQSVEQNSLNLSASATNEPDATGAEGI